MPKPEREIPQRELRNDITRVLREVAEGKTVRVTVKGRPVADLIPVSQARRFVARADFEPILRESPVDRDFAKDVQAALSSKVDEL
jgi:prevent-host-death family protein